MDLLLAFILAMVLTMALIPALMRRAGAMHVLDAPAERKVHARPMPRVGGIAMAVGVAVPLLLWLDLDRLTAAYLASALIVLLFGVWDDRATLSPGIKFLGQLIAVHIVVLVGGVEIHSLTFASRIELPEIIAAPLTAFFLLGVTNAINLSDGLDGLAGGTTFLCCVAIAVLSFGTDLAFVSTVAVVVMGSLLGFLRYNSFPARVFMGDGGSQFLGFTVGVLAVLLTQNEALPFSAALPLLLLGLPILDTLTVIAIRLREGRSPFSADKNHLHHRLLGRGFEHFEAVAVIYLLQGVLFLLAWQLRFHSDVTIVAVFLGFAAALLMALFVAEHRGWRWHGLGEFRLGTARISETLVRLKQPRRMPRWTAIVVMGCVLLYFAGVAIAVGPVGRDIGWLAVALCTVLGLAILQRSEMPGIAAVTQGALYVAVVMAVYLDHVAAGSAGAVRVRQAGDLPGADAGGGAAAAPVARTALRGDAARPAGDLRRAGAAQPAGTARCTEQPRAQRRQARGAVLRARDAGRPLGADQGVAVAERGGVPGGVGGAGVGPGESDDTCHTK